MRNPRSRNAPAAFIQPCKPTLAKKVPTGPRWAYEVKHDGYRLQIHARAGRVRLYTMNGADWTERYPLVVAEAARLKVEAVIDAELVCTDADGLAVFDMLHSRCCDHQAIACAFDILMLAGDDVRPRPYQERKAALRKALARAGDGLQHVEHAEGDGEAFYAAACATGLEGIVCKRLTAPYRSGRAKSWLKVKNPKAPAMLRMEEGQL